MASPPCDKCIKACPGQRVVRGPGWWGGSEDGVVDAVGTVVSVCQPGTGTGYTSHPIEVQWDFGSFGCYRACCTSGTCDLRLIDAGPAGVIFPDITCCYCETKGVVGTLWKCAECDDYNLCHSCYMSDKHNLEHEFHRYDGPSSERFCVPSRKKSQKFRFQGIFPGAEVYSHNEVKTGIVRIIRGKARLLRTTDAGKSCYNNADKVDDSLKLKTAAWGGYYYRDHMPAIASPGHDPKDIDLFHKNWTTLCPGGEVQVIRNQKQLERIHAPSPNASSTNWCGDKGNVLNITESGWMKVNDGRYTGLFHPQCLIPLKTSSRSTINMLGRDISSGGKGLGYGLSKKVVLHATCDSDRDEVVRMLVMAGADLEEADENGDKAVHHAAGREQSMILELLLSAGANKSACNNFNETALHVAIKENSVYCARVLAKNIEDSDINIQDNAGDTVLHSAIKAGMQEIISLILQRPTVNVAIKNDEGETALHVAVAKANLGATQQILQNRTDIVDEKSKKKVTALHIAASNNIFEIAKTLLAEGGCNPDIECGSDLKTALATAVAHGYSDIVELLVESGADVNKSDHEGNSPLHLCVTNTRALIHPSPSRAPKMALMVTKLQAASSQRQLNGMALAGLLASKGGDLQQKNNKGFTPPQLCDSTALFETLLLWNTQESATGRYREQLSHLINAKDENGMNLLHREALNGRHHTAQLLLAQGLVTVDTVGGQKSKTALSIALERGDSKFVDILLKASADVNKEDADGNTPLHTCLMSQNCESVELLVEAGADVNKQDANGNTPLHISLMTRREVKVSEINPAVAPKLKAIATELENVNHGDINTTLALACFFISNGSSLKLKNAQGLNPLNIVDAIPAIRILLKWAPKRSEPQAVGESAAACGGENTSVLESAASSTENTSGPVVSDEQAHCSSEKQEPKQEEIDDRHACAICMERERNVAFLCGHGTCQECATKIQLCHVCRAPVEKQIKLYEG